MTLSETARLELHKLFRQSGHYLAGLAGVLALGFVSFPVFTRVFSVSDYGVIDYVQKVVLLLSAAAKLGQQNSAVRFYGEQVSGDRAAKLRYYTTMFYGMGLTSAAVAAAFTAAVWLAPRWLIDAPMAGLLCFAATLIFLRGLESLMWAFLRVEERTKAYGVATVAMKAATIAAVCLLLLLGGRSPRTYFTGAIAVETATVAILTVWLFRRGLIVAGAFDRSLFRVSAAFGAPLVVYELAAIVLDSGDRFLVRHYLGAQPLGLYSVAYGLSSYVNDILVAPLSLALMPIYMRLWSTEGRAKTIEFLSATLDLFLMAAAGMLAAACVLSRDGLLVLASSKYRGAERLMPMLVAGLLLYTTYIFLSAGLLIHKRTITMAKLLLASAAANIALNVWLLPRMGLMAAALATLLSYALCVLLLGWASFRVLPLRLNGKAMARYAAAAFAAWAVTSRIEMGSPLATLAARAASVPAIYLGLLCALDGRVRSAAAQFITWVKLGPGPGRAGVETVGRQEVSQ